MRVALIGYTGYWGQKIHRVLIESGHAVDPINSKNINALEDSDADAAFIITPPATHFKLAMRAMKLGMDVLVAKPMTTSPKEAELMVDYAHDHDLVLMVDNTFLFTKAFAFLEEIEEPLISYQSLRLSPPAPQAVINAGWDMIAHDFAVLSSLGALRQDDGRGQVDGSIASCALSLPSGGSAFMSASRAWPYKIREVFLHFPQESYLWTLDGLYSGDRAVVKEDQEALVRMVSRFDVRRDKRAYNDYLISNGSENLAVVRALDRVFPRERLFDNGKYAQSYKETLVRAT